MLMDHEWESVKSQTNTPIILFVVRSLFLGNFLLSQFLYLYYIEQRKYFIFGQNKLVV